MDSSYFAQPSGAARPGRVACCPSGAPPHVDMIVVVSCTIELGDVVSDVSLEAYIERLMRPSDSAMRLASLSASGSLFGMPSLTDLTNTSSPLCTLLFSIITFPSMYPAQNALNSIGLLVDFCLHTWALSQTRAAA